MSRTVQPLRLWRHAAHTGEVLTPEALDFVAQLHRNFNAERIRLLEDRAARQVRFEGGELPDFKPNPIEGEDPDWRVAPALPDFDDRRVETGHPRMCSQSPLSLSERLSR